MDTQQGYLLGGKKNDICVKLFYENVLQENDWWRNKKKPKLIPIFLSITYIECDVQTDF